MDTKARLVTIDGQIHAATHEIDRNQQTVLRLLADAGRLLDRNEDLKAHIDVMLETRAQVVAAQRRRDGGL